MYKQLSTSFNASLLVVFISISPSLSASDLPQTSGDILSKRYVPLETFVAAALPKTTVTIWVPICKGSPYKRNTARSLAFQDHKMQDKSSRISEELYAQIQIYITLLRTHLKAFNTHLTELHRHPADREAVLTRNSDRRKCKQLITAYEQAITLLEEVKKPDLSRPAGGSPLVRKFSPWV